MSSHVQVARSGTYCLSTAERARTIMAVASSMQVGILNMCHDVGRHAVANDGSVFFVAPTDSPERAFAVSPHLPAPTVTAVAYDVAPVPQANRIRGIVTMTGSLTQPTGCPAGVMEHLLGDRWDSLNEPPVLLRLIPTAVTLEWRCELSSPRVRLVPETVPITSYRTAPPDPLIIFEGEWLPHLAEQHTEVLRMLVHRMLPEAVIGGDVVPQAVDRYGLVLRAYEECAPNRPLDVRIEFDRPVMCGCTVPEAFEALLADL